MKQITQISGTALPFLREDIDTDQLIPARFLKGTTKTGLGQYLFYDWRYDEQGQIKPDSLFDSEKYHGAKILIASTNFGCGSSREHAPWALKDFGFEAVIAPSFADIFYNNALKNQVLPIVLPLEQVIKLGEIIANHPQSLIEIDLPHQEVKPFHSQSTTPKTTSSKLKYVQGKK